MSYDRRKFLKLFAAGSAGLTVAGKLALADDIKNWMLSPQKTIFIPPEKKVEVLEWTVFPYDELPIPHNFIYLIRHTYDPSEFAYAK